MAAAEAALAALGPSFAPEDPTLPKPWKGLIDGSTGVLYYWNPETNVTQYEKPAGSSPPLPPGLPPSASPLNAAPIPTAQNIPSNGSLLHQQSGQQTPHQQQLVQQQRQNQPQLPPIQQSVQQMTLQQLQQLPYQQLPSVQNQQPMEISQQYSQIQQLPYQQNSYMQGQLMSRPQGQFPYQPGQQSQAFQFSYQHGQQLPGPKIPQHSAGKQTQEPQIVQQLQGSRSSHQLGKHLHFPDATHEQGQSIQRQQTAQQLSQQIGFSGLGDADHQEGKLAGLPLSVSQQAANHQLSGLTPQAQISQPGTNMIQPHLHHQLGEPSLSNSQPVGMSQSQQVSLESGNHQIRTGIQMFPNQMGHSMVHPPIGSKIGYDEDQHERGGSQFYSSGRAEGQMMHPVQPKLAPLPLARKQQDMRLGAIPPKFNSPGHPGGSNMSPGHAMQNMYSNAAFPNATSVRPTPRMFEPPDSPNISTDAYRRHHEVTAMGDNIPAPFMTFDATGFPPEILREIHASGFLSPTPIQAQTWPIALQNRDIVAIAKTGSGKTLGYLIPAFIHLRRCQNNPQFGPIVLILSPTRELATQIQEEAMKFGRSSHISCTCLYGGAPKGPQLKEIERGVDIIVATPGRLNDILEMGRINFRQVSFLVLDEADRMLDMGFELQIRKIIKEIPPRRQTLMYTATWPVEVRKIAGDLLVNPVQVNIGSVDELVANKSITQFVEVVPQMDKQRRLEQFLRSQERGAKIIIFCSTKKLCDQLARSIGRPFGAIAIHGDKSQTERDHVLSQFRSGKFPVLVATDVAARGLDIKDIRVVINYDFPTGIEDYVHRIGRTGRAGATGVSYTFFTDQDWKHASELIKVLEGANQRVPPEVREMAARRGPPSQRIPSHGEMSRWNSSGGNGSVCMDFSGNRGMREFGHGGNSGSGRGFVGRGGRSDSHSDGRGESRGRGFGRGGRGRHDRGGPRDWFQNSDGRGRYDGRRGFEDRMRSCGYSHNPEKVLNRGYDRSRSPSRSRSRSPSWSSRSRSWSRSRSQSPSHSRRSPGHETRRRRVSGFDAPLMQVAGVGVKESEARRQVSSVLDAPHSIIPPAVDELPESERPHISAPLAAQMSPMSLGDGNGSLTGV